MWSIEVWDKISCFFPDNGCGSRVVVTTRISNVATHLSSSSFEMNLLDEDKSWKLFCEKTFSEEGCPPELEEIGKKIVRDCKGLPLSISVIGGLLRKNMTREYWEIVARDTNSNLMLEKNEHCLNILSLSYNHLPAHLKPCFLYIGIFQKHCRVNFTGLIKLFVAEGFLRPNKHQSLEEIASDYLNDLVDRNLILVQSRKFNGRIKYLRMHDLVTEVCLRIAEKEKIFYKMWLTDNPPDMSRERRIALLKKDWPQVFDVFPTTSRLRTFISNWMLLPFNCWLLRVAYRIDIDSMEDIHQLVNLRYLDCKLFWRWEYEKSYCKLPSSISLLWNLQTLIMDGIVEIWHMRQLRHLQFYVLFLPYPPSDKVDQQDDFLLPNLRTLYRVMNFSFTEEVCKRIPNITKLRIYYDDFSKGCQQKSYYLNNLVKILKLESLRCSFRHLPERGDLLQSLLLPMSLRKLSLWKCCLRWEDLISFGFSLPHLEVLKLYWNSVVGPEWDCIEGAFPSLRFLAICDANLMKWNVEDSDFPKLETLHLRNLENLENIPSGIGDIQTLQYLHLYHSSESTSNSAIEILEEQRSLGKDYLQVEVRRKSRA